MISISEEELKNKCPIAHSLIEKQNSLFYKSAKFHSAQIQKDNGEIELIAIYDIDISGRMLHTIVNMTSSDSYIEAYADIPQEEALKKIK